jgi:hypothetical protein
MARKKIQIEKIDNSIAVRVEQKNGSYSDNFLYPVANIRSVEHQIQIGFNPIQTDNNRLMNYPYEDKLLIMMNFVEGVATLEYFDIQDVDNQVGWTADAAGLTQALSDINGWLINSSPSVLPTGASTEAKQDDQITLIGALTETAPATDTASSGLNGRLQRIAQRITSLIALLPASLGQKARASSFAVTLSTEDITLLTDLKTALNHSIGTSVTLAGVSGTETLSGGKKVGSLSCVSSAGGTVSIDGVSITIPAGGNFSKDYKFNLLNPTIIFTGTDSYELDYIV